MNIMPSTPEQHTELLKLWEASVRATHHFLNDRQISEIRQQIIDHQYFQHVALFHVEQEHEIQGFIGLSENKIEMLFIAPDLRRQGIGLQLLQHALTLGATQVDVNEQNPEATAFYLKHGFEVYQRSETDDAGNPFPILHMQLTSSHQHA